VSSNETAPVARSIWTHSNRAESAKVVAPLDGETLWDHSAHIIDFVKAVLEDRDALNVEHEASEVLSSLRKLVQTLDDPTATRGLFFPSAKPAKPPHMPPLEAAVTVLRWAKG
jgi:hypothetical protein